MKKLRQSERARGCLGILKTDGHDLSKNRILILFIEAMSYWTR